MLKKPILFYLITCILVWLIFIFSFIIPQKGIAFFSIFFFFIGAYLDEIILYFFNDGK